MKRIILLIALISIGVSSFAQNSTLAKGKKVNIEMSEAGMKPGTSATSGSLTTGLSYVIGLFVAGDDFTNVGAGSNASGVEFIATGTTPTTWTNSSLLSALNQSTTDLADNSTITANNVYPTQGVRGNGQKWFKFDGTDDYVNIADAAAFDFGTLDFTLHATFTPDNVTDQDKYIINKEAGGVGYGLQQYEDDIKIRFDDNTTDVSAVISTGVLAANTEVVVFVTFDRSGNATCYVDGVASGTVAISTANLTLSNAGALRIGTETGGTTNAFDGDISWVGEYNYLPSSDSIASWSTKIAEGTFHLPAEDQGADNSELITNGTFTGSSTGWTEGTGWAYGTNNEACAANGSQGNLSSTAFSTTTVGKTYRLNYEIVANTLTGTGNFRMVGGAPSNIIVSDQNLTHTVGSYEIDIVSSNAGTILRMNLTSGYTGGTLTIDNIYLTELGSTLSLSPEGIYSTAWNDYYHLESYAVSGPTREEYGKHTALRFNGSDSKLTRASSYEINTNSSIVTFWAKRDASGTAHTIAGLAGSNTESYIQFTDSGTITMETDTNTDVATGTLDTDDTSWHSYVIVFNSLAVSMYQDGVAITMADGTVTDGELTIDQLGVLGASTSYYNGEMEGFDVYDKGLVPMPIAEFALLFHESTK